MALTKQPVAINFTKGVETKSDPYQIPMDSFLALQNSVFDKTGKLTKRNGYGSLTTLPNTLQTTITTLNDNLLATGSNLYAYSADLNQWYNKGTIQPVTLDTLSLVRSTTSQTAPDIAVASNGLACLVYVDTSVAYYQISDSTTGQQIIARTALPSTATNPRVFILGRYFIITFAATVSATTHLRYLTIPISNPSSPGTATDISTAVRSLTAGYDAYVANNNLYLAWAASSTTIKIGYLTSTLTLSAAVTITSHPASIISVTADTSASLPVIWVSYWDAGTTNGYIAAFSSSLAVILASQQIITTLTINELTSVATAGVCTIILDNNAVYGYSPYTSTQTDYISYGTVTQAGVGAGPFTVARSVGLASKAFIADDGGIYFLATYSSANQPTYFLMNTSGNISMRLAYSNGGGYLGQILPNVCLVGTEYMVPYLVKDFLASVNKGTNLPSGTPANGIYTQVGINLAKFEINTTGQQSSEIAGALHLTGGQLWEYDGTKPVEHGFHLWPDYPGFASATTGGSIAKSVYYYIFTYEWTDNAGNLHRSAPSIPLKVDISGSSTDTNTNTLYVPTLRLTYKVSPNPVRIVGYRWSTAQQTYYQFTSITSPAVNDTTTDNVTITDTLADASILGNTLLYTTGGVIENIAAPASADSALYKNRLFLIDAEDKNLLWYSKQVIENTPVEMSDLLTLYVAPTTGAQGSTGPMTALSAMDDKLIIFKRSAIYYETGTGPDNTGANNDFSDPVYVTASVGCANPNSIVLTPNGIMFQSDKGIWLLGRDLSTSYIGAPVEAYNSQTVLSADVIPGTNQVRFILDNRITLMYDYYYNQWGTFNNISAISATLYNNYHTYLNSSGQVYQETPGLYLDGSSPVLLSLTSAWINLAGLQGFERFYFLYLLGTYYTPFTLNVQIAYDYNSSPSQSIIVSPDNYVANWGDEQLWGSSGPWGGPGNVFEARIFPKIQKCSAFQITITERYDASFGAAAGQGLSLSGMNMIIGTKKGYRTQKASRSFG